MDKIDSDDYDGEKIWWKIIGVTFCNERDGWKENDLLDKD